MTLSIMRITIVILTILCGWEGFVWFYSIPAYILPPPHAVLTVLYLKRVLIGEHALTTLIEVLMGFSLGIMFGSITGIVVAYFKPLTAWFLPILIISQATPTFAIAPLIVIWFGFGIASKIVTAVLMIYFPIASALYDGLRKTHEGWESLAQSMGASKWRLFLHIRLPASLPSFASGIRIAAVIAPIGAIIGEWVGSSRGLGFLMLNANAQLQIDMMFASLLVIILLALILYFSVDKFLRYVIWWQEQ